MLNLLSAIEVASGERGDNTESLIARFNNKFSDTVEYQHDGNSLEGGWYYCI
jgi:hypothetical protein